MKQIFLFSFIIIMSCAALFYPVQNKAQQVIASSGGHYQDENISLSWTVGEPVIETFSGGNVVLTQGFQQPYSFYLQQILNIPAGWSGVSSFIDPLNKNVDGLFLPAVNDLVILASMNGVYYPGEEINTIGNWNYMDGYQVKAENEFELTVTGSKIPLQNLAIAEGWNLIPVLSNCEADVEDMFSVFTGLQIVKQVAGSYLYWPAYNINTLGNLQPGKAYFVASEESGTISFPECSKSSPLINPKQEPKNITPWNNLSYSSNSHVVALPATIFENSGIQPGDVIGAFTMDGICAGFLEVENLRTNTALTVYGDDAFTTEKDGFENVEPFHFMIYRPQSDEVFDLEVEFDPTMPHTGYFAGHGISAVSSLKLQSAAITESSNISMEVYPNPSRGIFNIRINRTLENPRFQVTDFRGSLVKSIQLEKIQNGETLNIDLSDLQSGVYFLKLQDEGFVGMEKIVVQ